MSWCHLCFTTSQHAGGCLVRRITGADRLVLLGQRVLAVGRAAHEGISALQPLRCTVPQLSDGWCSVLVSFNALSV